MLTIRTFKKLEGLVLMDGLNVESIFEFNERYSIWLSDGTNIEIDRDRHWKGGNYTYYKMYIAGGTTAMTEFITIKTINTLDKMRVLLIYIKEKYKTK
jgi:hypothetical protein